MNQKAYQNTIGWYDTNAKQYAQTIAAKPVLSNINLFLHLLPAHAQILDAGCAGGRDADIMRQRGYTVTGIDISQGLIEVARKAYPTINFVLGSMLQMPFGGESFDGIWAHASLVHMPSIDDAKQAISEFARILRPGGFFYTIVKAKTGSEETALVNDSYSDVPRFFRYYTQEEMQGLVSQQGFEIIKNELQQDLGKRSGVAWVMVIARKR